MSPRRAPLLFRVLWNPQDSQHEAELTSPSNLGSEGGRGRVYLVNPKSGLSRPALWGSVPSGY